MTIKAGQSNTVHLPIGQVLSLACPAGTAGSAVRLSDLPGSEPYAPIVLNGANVNLGPYGTVTRINVSCNTCTITDSVAPYVPTSGDATGSAATAGQVGELITSQILLANAVALTTNTAANVTSIALTPGEWEIDGQVDFNIAGTTNVTQLVSGASSTSATVGSQDTYDLWNMAANVPGGDISNPIPKQRFLLSAATTIYLVAKAVFTVSTCKGYGIIRARRVR